MRCHGRAEWQMTCVEASGGFARWAPTPDDPGFGMRTQWSCTNTEGLSQDTFDALMRLCFEAGGFTESSSNAPPYVQIWCYLP